MQSVWAALWSGDVRDDAEAARLEALARAVRPADVIALLNFPRPEDIASATGLGARHVLSLPLAVEDLWQVLALKRPEL
jgi:hypothetical protein